jgi:hypothetical protein
MNEGRYGTYEMSYGRDPLPIIREALEGHMIAQLIDVVIGYERRDGCVCYTFGGDARPYFHFTRCPYLEACYECHGCRQHRLQVHFEHEPTCSGYMPKK